MTLLYLVRHAAHARQHDGTLVGRTPGIGLGAAAPDQLRWLRDRLTGVAFDAVLSSPRRRAVETAHAISSGEPAVAAELDEVDFGAWTGCSFAELAGEPAWERWNRERSRAVAPGGESMAAAQRRAWSHVAAVAARHPDASVAMVSHCDIIRGLIAYCIGLPLDNLLRFDIDPASVSRIVVGSWGARVVSVNERLYQ